MSEPYEPGSAEPTVVEPEPPQSPYRNLLVPLVVTPALIVMVLVLVYALFGALAGEASTPTENLQRMLHGGRNERRQATFELVRQLNADRIDRSEGRAPEWDLEASLLPELRREWQETPPEDPTQRYVLAVFLARVGGTDDLEPLISILDLPEEADPDGTLRFGAVVELGLLGPELDARGRERAARAAAGALESDDTGVRIVAAAALQTLDAPVAREALRGALDDPSLEVRGSAAISLSLLGDPAGAEVLRELVRLAPYEGEQAADPTAWASEASVSESRRRAIQALGRLGRPEDEAFLREVAAEDPDLHVREAALRTLGDGAGGVEAVD